MNNRHTAHNASKNVLLQLEEREAAVRGLKTCKQKPMLFTLTLGATDKSHRKFDEKKDCLGVDARILSE